MAEWTLIYLKRWYSYNRRWVVILLFPKSAWVLLETSRLLPFYERCFVWFLEKESHRARLMTCWRKKMYVLFVAQYISLQYKGTNTVMINDLLYVYLFLTIRAFFIIVFWCSFFSVWCNVHEKQSTIQLLIMSLSELHVKANHRKK